MGSLSFAETHASATGPPNVSGLKLASDVLRPQPALTGHGTSGISTMRLPPSIVPPVVVLRDRRQQYLCGGEPGGISRQSHRDAMSDGLAGGRVGDLRSLRSAHHAMGIPECSWPKRSAPRRRKRYGERSAFSWLANRPPTVFHGFTTGALKVKKRVADSEQGCRKPARKGTKGLCGLASGLDVRDAVAIESEARHVYAVMSLPLICKSNPLGSLT